jgi:hypothetical protein
MTDNQPREHVLLSWQMPILRRASYIIMACSITVVLVVAAYAAAGGARYPLDRWLPVIFVAIAAIGLGGHVFGPFLYAAADMRCTQSGLDLEPVLSKPVRVPWSNVKALKRTFAGHKILLFDLSPGFMYLRVPPSVLNQLIALLREASNARIIGFD